MKIHIVFIIVFCMFFTTQIYGITTDFKNMITELGIPRYNTKGFEINEKIYENYNLFLYGGPTSITGSNQRWKNLSNGKWIRYGVRGEYEILGFDYSSSIVYNYYFPLDRVTSTPVEKWKFANISDALLSWQRAEKLYSKEQVEYMREANWWFQNIKGGKNDPYDQREYNLNAIKVGFSKCRLETPATWKTKGSILTMRKTETGGRAWANFAVEPMAADASLESNLEVDLEFILDENSDEIAIPLEYGASLYNLSKYAREKHIKEIVSKLSINEREVSKISGSKITSVGNKFMLVITRNQIPQNKDYQFKVKVHSFVKTDFLADGLIQADKEATVIVHVKPKKVIPIVEGTLSILSKSENLWVVSPLAQNIETIKYNSSGITEAGRYCLIRCKLDSKYCNKGDIKGVTIKLDNAPVENVDILPNTTKDLLIYFKIPEKAKTTLYGWKSLRSSTGNFFKVNNNQVLNRKEKPHVLSLSYDLNNISYEENFLFDTIDDYISNMNNDISDKLNITRYNNYEILTEVLDE